MPSAQSDGDQVDVLVRWECSTCGRRVPTDWRDKPYRCPADTRERPHGEALKVEYVRQPHRGAVPDDVLHRLAEAVDDYLWRMHGVASSHSCDREEAAALLKAAYPDHPRGAVE